MLYKVALNCESIDKIQESDHSSKSCWAVQLLSYGLFNFAQVKSKYSFFQYDTHRSDYRVNCLQLYLKMSLQFFHMIWVLSKMSEGLRSKQAIPHIIIQFMQKNVTIVGN